MIDKGLFVLIFALFNYKAGSAQYLISWPVSSLICANKTETATIQVLVKLTKQYGPPMNFSLWVKVTDTGVLFSGRDSMNFSPAELAPLYVPAASNDFRTRHDDSQDAVFNSNGNLLQLTPNNKVGTLNGYYIKRFQYHSKQLISYRDSGMIAGIPHNYERYYLLDTLGRLRLVSAFDPLPYMRGDSLMLTALPPDCGGFTRYEYRQNRLVSVKMIDQDLKNQLVIVESQEFEYDKKGRPKKSIYHNYQAVIKEKITFIYKYH
jgi:hypothetical protein